MNHPTPGRWTQPDMQAGRTEPHHHGAALPSSCPSAVTDNHETIRCGYTTEELHKLHPDVEVPGYPASTTIPSCRAWPPAASSRSSTRRRRLTMSGRDTGRQARGAPRRQLAPARVAHAHEGDHEPGACVRWALPRRRAAPSPGDGRRGPEPDAPPPDAAPSAARPSCWWLGRQGVRSCPLSPSPRNRDTASSW
jgi:hypothetical protein